MTTFLLIRHATTAWIGRGLAGHTEGVGLDGRGSEEAQRVAGHLRRFPIRAIYSSPLQRALETARPLADLFGLAVTQRERLTEIRFGRWSGRRMDEVEPEDHWARFNRLRSFTRPPGGELMLEVQARIADELEELSGRHQSETVALVSHADVIRAALFLCLGAPLDLFYRLEVSPASISTIRFDHAGPAIASVNVCVPDFS